MKRLYACAHCGASFLRYASKTTGRRAFCTRYCAQLGAVGVPKATYRPRLARPKDPT